MKSLIRLTLLTIAIAFWQPAFAMDGKINALEQVWSGNQSNNRKPEATLAHSQDEWLGLWQKTENGTITQPIQKGQTAIGLFDGSRTTSGYSLAIQDITEEPNKIIVVYKEYKPGQTNMTASPYQTSPWLIALIANPQQKPVTLRQESSPALYHVEKAASTVVDTFKGLWVTGFNSRQK